VIPGLGSPRSHAVVNTLEQQHAGIEVGRLARPHADGR
jgi:hypothetical protein